MIPNKKTLRKAPIRPGPCLEVCQHADTPMNAESTHAASAGLVMFHECLPLHGLVRTKGKRGQRSGERRQPSS